MKVLKSLFDIKDRIAVLSGGGGILAGEMAKGLLDSGAKVILLDINEENLNKKVNALKKDDNEIFGYQCDVLDENNLKSVNEKILSRYGKIDILVNAAGGNMTSATIGIGQTIFDMKIENFRKVTDLNLIGTVLPTLIFGEDMAKQKSGSIINISSMASTSVITRVVGYSAAKAAIDNFTKWIAVELAQKFGDKLRVNAIAPGFLITEQNRSLLTNEDGSLTDRGNTILKITPFKRFGEPDELVGTVLWLASDASKFVTGAVIPIDGGFSIFSGV
jgi:NAD(P)-dependent dehydrogenase (short-subunit alcohol dehydrogenase family)